MTITIMCYLKFGPSRIETRVYMDWPSKRTMTQTTTHKFTTRTCLGSQITVF